MDWYRELVFKEKRFGCEASKENSLGEECMAGVCEVIPIIINNSSSEKLHSDIWVYIFKQTIFCCSSILIYTNKLPLSMP